VDAVSSQKDCDVAIDNVIASLFEDVQAADASEDSLERESLAKDGFSPEEVARPQGANGMVEHIGSLDSLVGGTDAWSVADAKEPNASSGLEAAARRMEEIGEVEKLEKLAVPMQRTSRQPCSLNGHRQLNGHCSQIGELEDGATSIAAKVREITAQPAATRLKQPSWLAGRPMTQASEQRTKNSDMFRERRLRPQDLLFVAAVMAASTSLCTLEYVKALGVLGRYALWTAAIDVFDRFQQRDVQNLHGVHEAQPWCTLAETCKRSPSGWRAATSVLKTMFQRRIEPKFRVPRRPGEIASSDGPLRTLTPQRTQAMMQVLRDGSLAKNQLLHFTGLLRKLGGLQSREHTTVISRLSKAMFWQHALLSLSCMKQDGVQPELQTYNALINSCAGGCQWVLALLLIEEMQRGRVVPDLLTFSSTINACRDGESWWVALAMLAAAQREGLPADLITCSAVMTACAKGAQWQRTLELLNEIQRQCIVQDVVCYSAAIHACAAGEQWGLALLLMADMMAVGIQPNVVSFGAAISACDKGGEWQMALVFLSRGRPNVISFVAAISACAKGGAWQAAAALFATMRDHTYVPDAIVYGALISACGISGQWQFAIGLLGDMVASSVSPLQATLNQAICACASVGQWKHTLVLLGDLQTLRLAPDECSSSRSYVGAIHAGTSNSHWKEAYILLRAMLGRRLRPPVDTFLSVRAVANYAPLWQIAFDYPLVCGHHGLELDSVGCNMLVDLCSGQSWERGTSLMHDMKRSGIALGMDAYNSQAYRQARACQDARQWRRAIFVLEQARSSNLRPNSQTRTTVVAACEQAGSWQLAFGVVEAMSDWSMDLEMQVCTSLIAACGWEERWKSALNLLAMVSDHKFTSTTGTFNAALETCGRSSKWDAVVGLFEDMLTRHLQLDSGTYMATLRASRMGGASKNGQAMSLLMADMQDVDVHSWERRDRLLPLRPMHRKFVERAYHVSGDDPGRMDDREQR